MHFVWNAPEVARQAMDPINPDITEAYVRLIAFLSEEPGAASPMRGRGGPPVGSVDYIRRQAVAFAASREPKRPVPPTTVPDEMVSVILISYFGLAPEEAERAKGEHLLSMGAENLVGELLERYLASVLEPRGWIWCSGSIVKAVDFIKPPGISGGSWRLLQVKNRDNSENSSSSKIRLGTNIEKWHRTFSRRGGSNWAAFPDENLRHTLSEEGFKDFVRVYLGLLAAIAEV